MTVNFSEQTLCSYVDEHTVRLIQILRDLVSIPSENTPPMGSEANCQNYVANFLTAACWSPEVYSIRDVEGLLDHPLFRPERNYENRPNVVARRKGNGDGQSLLLSGHIDTVPRGSFTWTKDPFGGEVENNRLYGRGANDMKGGVATNLFVAEAVQKLGLTLAGDLFVETVVDEEFGGVNGTLAGRVKGIVADAAIVSEPSFLRVCPAQRGGRIAHITLESAGGVLTEGALPTGVIDQLTFVLANLKHFAQQRKAAAPCHEMYDSHEDPVPVTVTKITTSPWGTKEPITVPEQCKIELYWQAMPGEELDAIDRQFLSWLDSLVSVPGGPLTARPKIEFPIRWLPGSAIPATEPLVQELADCATQVLGRRPVIAGIEGPCDMYIFHQHAHIPAVLWGARGGNTHAADEYVEIDSLVQATKTLLLFVCRWCRVI